jgi:hypothetical protein
VLKCRPWNSASLLQAKKPNIGETEMLKKIIALTIAAGFASASFAQGTTAAPSATIKATTPAASESKTAEPAKAEAAATDSAKSEVPKTVKHKHAKKVQKTEAAEQSEAAAK